MGYGDSGALVAADDREFAESILRLLDEPDHRASITGEARALAERQYTWQSVGAGFSELVANMVTPA